MTPVASVGAQLVEWFDRVFGLLERYRSSDPVLFWILVVLLFTVVWAVAWASRGRQK